MTKARNCGNCRYFDNRIIQNYPMVDEFYRNSDCNLSFPQKMELKRKRYRKDYKGCKYWKPAGKGRGGKC